MGLIIQQETFNSFLAEKSFEFAEIKRFDRILRNNIVQYFESEIYSSGYVLHTLEAGLWCLLTSDNFRDTVLKAVNLGEDTDTTGAVAGGLAGILYGKQQIPTEWLEKLVRKPDIIKLAQQLEQSL